MKHCSRCGATKPRSDFYRDRSKRDGLSSACRPCCAAKRDEWRAANPERHREVYLAEAKRHYRNNREYHSEKGRRRRIEKPEEVWFVGWVQRCRDRGLGTDADALAYAKAIYHDPCSYCGRQPARGIDHIVPVSQGGTNDRDNLTAACWYCNGVKGTRSLLLALPSLTDRREAALEAPESTHAVANARLAA